MINVVNHETTNAKFQSRLEWEASRKACLDSQRQITEHDQGGILFGVKNGVNRKYLNVRAHTAERAKAATGWAASDILYTMQLERSPQQSAEKEVNMSRGTLEAIKKAREDPIGISQAAKPSEEAKKGDKNMKKSKTKTTAKSVKSEKRKKSSPGMIEESAAKTFTAELLATDPKMSASMAWRTLREKRGRFAWPKFKALFSTIAA